MTDRVNKAQQKGAQAKALAENELLNAILDEMDRDLVNAWRNSDGDDHDVRHNAYLMQRLLGDFKRRLGVIQKDGELAEKAARSGMIELD